LVDEKVHWMVDQKVSRENQKVAWKVAWKVALRVDWWET